MHAIYTGFHCCLFSGNIGSPFQVLLPERSHHYYSTVRSAVHPAPCPLCACSSTSTSLDRFFFPNECFFNFLASFSRRVFFYLCSTKWLLLSPPQISLSGSRGLNLILLLDPKHPTQAPLSLPLYCAKASWCIGYEDRSTLVEVISFQQSHTAASLLTWLSK